MAGPFAGSAKIAGRGDNPSAEMVHPDAVDHNTGGERIVLAGNRLGKLQTAAPLGEGGRTVLAKDREKAARQIPSDLPNRRRDRKPASKAAVPGRSVTG